MFGHHKDADHQCQRQEETGVPASSFTALRRPGHRVEAASAPGPANAPGAWLPTSLRATHHASPPQRACIRSSSDGIGTETAATRRCTSGRTGLLQPSALRSSGFQYAGQFSFEPLVRCPVGFPSGADHDVAPAAGPPQVTENPPGGAISLKRRFRRFLLTIPWPSFGTIQPTRGRAPGVSRTWRSSDRVLVRTPRRRTSLMSRVRRIRAERGNRSCVGSVALVPRPGPGAGRPAGLTTDSA